MSESEKSHNLDDVEIESVEFDAVHLDTGEVLGTASTYKDLKKKMESRDEPWRPEERYPDH